MIDSHCHLNRIEDCAGYLSRAQLAGIKALLSVATSLEDHEPLLELIRTQTSAVLVWMSVGVHPDSSDATLDINRLKQQCKAEKVIAIGETGLDFFYDHNQNHQLDCFEQHIRLAKSENLPLIIHTRSAESQTLELLKAYSNIQGVIHCFTGSHDFARAVLDLGLFISFSGIITFPKQTQDLCAIAQWVPQDRLLIETDAPFLAPVPKRGQKNESSFLPFTAEKLAQLRQLSLPNVIEWTTNNFYTLFSKANAS